MLAQKLHREGSPRRQCGRTKIKHLREASPVEDLYVTLSLRMPDFNNHCPIQPPIGQTARIRQISLKVSLALAAVARDFSRSGSANEAEPPHVDTKGCRQI